MSEKDESQDTARFPLGTELASRNLGSPAREEVQDDNALLHFPVAVVVVGSLVLKRGKGGSAKGKGRKR